MNGSKPMFFKLCTFVFSLFFLAVFLLEYRHGIVYFKEPREWILIPEIFISAGLGLFAFKEVLHEWREGEWFWRR